MQIANIFSPKSLIWVALYLQCGVGLTEAIFVTSFEDNPSNPTTAGWKVFAFGGFGGDYSSDVEKVDPMKENTNCNKPADYPVVIDGPITEMIGDQSIISCGGHDDTIHKDTSDCYEYNQNSSIWTFVTNMIEEREHAASVLVGNDQIWITGGSNSIGAVLKSTELYDVKYKTFQTGPDLPQYWYDHCMTKLNETHVFIGGAYATDTCYLVDTGKDPFVFKKLPGMSRSRYGAGCGVVNIDLNTSNYFDTKEASPSRSKSVIVMVGGDEGQNIRKDSELYLLDAEEWIQGPLLPRGFEYGGSGNINDNSMIVAGGRDEDYKICDDIIMLNPNSLEFETLPGRLETPREWFGMTILMDNEDC